MTQINFTLDSQQIQDIISNSGANDLAKTNADNDIKSADGT